MKKQQLRKKGKVPHDGSGKAKSKASRTVPRLLYLLLFGFGVLLYANTVQHKYVLDDHSVIDENWVVKKGVEGIPIILTTPYRHGYWYGKGTLYRPLSLVMFALEWELSPDNPALGHTINIVLYGLTAIFLFVVLNSLFGPSHMVLSLLATLIFIAHPLHTEVVANIKGRDDIMCFLMLLGTAWALLKYLDKGKMLFLAASWVMFLLAFLSKENAVTFLAVFPIMVYYFRDVSWKRMVLPMMGLVAMAAIYIYLRLAILGHAGSIPVSKIDNILAAAAGPMEWYATATLILGRYLLLLIFPHPLVSDYSFDQVQVVGWANAGALISAIIVLAVLGFAIYKFRSKSILIFGILLAVVSVSIYTNYVITIGTHMAERLLYIPVLGFAIVIGWYLLKFFPAKDMRGMLKSKSLLLIAAPVLILMSFQTVSRNAAWESDLSLQSTDIKTHPKSARITYFLGMEIMKVKALNANEEQERKKYLQEAIELFNQALAIHPTYYHVYNQLGLAYYRLNDFDKAVEAYSIGLEHEPQAIGLSNMGAIYFKRNNFDKALELYEKSVATDPRFATGWMNLGSTYGMQKQYQKSVDAFLRGLKYDPDNAEINYYLGISYQFLNDIENSRRYTERAFALNPALRNK